MEEVQFSCQKIEAIKKNGISECLLFQTVDLKYLKNPLLLPIAFRTLHLLDPFLMSTGITEVLRKVVVQTYKPSYNY